MNQPAAWMITTETVEPQFFTDESAANDVFYSLNLIGAKGVKLQALFAEGEERQPNAPWDETTWDDLISPTIRSIWNRCEAGVDSFSNDDMSIALVAMKAAIADRINAARRADLSHTSAPPAQPAEFNDCPFCGWPYADNDEFTAHLNGRCEVYKPTIAQTGDGTAMRAEINIGMGFADPLALSSPAREAIKPCEFKSGLRLIEEKIDQALQGQEPIRIRLGVALNEARKMLLAQPSGGAQGDAPDLICPTCKGPVTFRDARSIYWCSKAHYFAHPEHASQPQKGAGQ